tara:strand:- start:759 stop:1196 length:438 start_codon:yes stop_codon:yes gene_type:complete
MAVTFSNNWKNILDRLESEIKSEFGASLSVYRAISVPKGISQALQLEPISSNLVEFFSDGETREYRITIKFVYNEANMNETNIDHIMRYVSRFEELIKQNKIMTLSDTNSTTVSNCRLEEELLNADPESGVYIVEWDYRCLHTTV